MSLKLTIDAPWTNGPKEYVGPLAFIAQTREQLLYYKKQQIERHGKATTHLLNDIEGYEVILKSNSTSNADVFMQIKQNFRGKRKPFKDNLAVIDHMRKHDFWDNDGDSPNEK